MRIFTFQFWENPVHWDVEGITTLESHTKEDTKFHNFFACWTGSIFSCKFNEKIFAWVGSECLHKFFTTLLFHSQSQNSLLLHKNYQQQTKTFFFSNIRFCNLKTQVSARLYDFIDSEYLWRLNKNKIWHFFIFLLLRLNFSFICTWNSRSKFIILCLQFNTRLFFPQNDQSPKFYFPTFSSCSRYFVLESIGRKTFENVVRLD